MDEKPRAWPTSWIIAGIRSRELESTPSDGSRSQGRNVPTEISISNPSKIGQSTGLRSDFA